MALAPPPPPLWGHHRPLGHCPIALWGLLLQENRRPFHQGLKFPSLLAQAQKSLVT